MILGWTHNLINLLDMEAFVTVMKCNEIFDAKHSDTILK